MGKRKDEFGGVIVVEFAGLKSKMYSVKKRLMVKNVIQWVSQKRSEYRNWKVKRIQSKKHKLGTYEIDKISLSCFDDKRHVLNDGIRTLAYFHKDSVTSCRDSNILW